MEVVCALNEIELAWAAGFFDGEGWTSADKNGAFYLGISQKDRRPIDRFIAAVGVGKVYVNRLYTTAMTGANAIEAATKLWPHLSEPKREQMRQAFSEAHCKRSRRYPKLNAIYDEFEGVIGEVEFPEHT